MRLRDENLVLREIDGETVLLDLATSTYFSSNTTGTFLLRLLAEDREREFLVAELAREFGLDAQEAAADADAFVAELVEQGLLV